jgi:hypothetical protein
MAISLLLIEMFNREAAAPTDKRGCGGLTRIIRADPPHPRLSVVAILYACSGDESALD